MFYFTVKWYGECTVEWYGRAVDGVAFSTIEHPLRSNGCFTMDGEVHGQVLVKWMDKWWMSSRVKIGRCII